MTLKEWEKKLKKHLKKLPKQEQTEIISYYREMYGDKLDAGHTNAEILHEFGLPEDCAARILAEEHPEEINLHASKKTNNGPSVAYIVGMIFFTLIIILPLSIAALGVIISFGAASLSGCVASLMGIVIILWSPFQFTGVAAIMAGVSIGIIAIGIGMILFVTFWLATKYIAIGTVKALRMIYGGKHNHE